MFTVGDFPKLFSKANLMALIVFTVIFSIAVIMAGEKGKPIVKAMDNLTAVVVNVINIVMKLAPLGLGCYFAILIGKYGNQVIGPLGANLHKDGACIIQILKISLLCTAFGINYATPRNLIMSIVVAVIASVVMGGIPAGGYVAEIFIVSVFGFPTVSIPIMVLIGTITDAPATAINVTGDTGLAMIIARVVHGKGWLKKAETEKAAVVEEAA